MDLDGSWNPPESWPESSPPLPGWVRADDGKWQSPVDVVEPIELGIVTPAQRPIPDTPHASDTETLDELDVTEHDVETHDAETHDVEANPEPRSEQQSKPIPPPLQYAEADFLPPQPDVVAEAARNRAMRAALIAGVLAAMIGIGIGLLLATL